MSPASIKRPHVLILGAGLGGLTLAQALRKQGMTYELFERDASMKSRAQGWAIALHSILPDLRSSLPDDLPPIEVTNHLLPLSDPAGFKMYFESEDTLKMGYGKEYILRANRKWLRNYLATDIDIQWGKRVSKIDETDDSVTLHFEDGTTATGDVLVGADGSNSQVRNHIFDGKDQLNTLPVAQVIGELVLNKAQYERQMELGRSFYAARGGSLRVFVGLSRISNDASKADYYWMIGVVKPDGTAEDGTWTQHKTKQELYDFAMSQLHNLDPKLHEIFRLTKPDDIYMPSLVLRDMILDSMPNTRITLLGDAAHPMTPYRGEGGNQAMQDSLDLARAMAEAEPATVTEVLKSYQEEMLARGTASVRKSRLAVFDDGSSSRDGFLQNLKKVSG